MPEFVFDECAGTTQHATCPRSLDLMGFHLGDCACPCHVTNVTVEVGNDAGKVNP